MWLGAYSCAIDALCLYVHRYIYTYRGAFWQQLFNPKNHLNKIIRLGYPIIPSLSKPISLGYPTQKPMFGCFFGSLLLTSQLVTNC